MTSTSGLSPLAGREGPLLAQADFDAMFARLDQGASFPNDPERGALNWITAATVLRATAEAVSGSVVATALPLNRVPGPDNAKPALHYMTEMTDVDGEPGSNKDFIGLDYHGKAVSHLDAPTHIAYRGRLFGGRDSKTTVTTRGSTWATVDRLGPIVTRGVLIDVARHRGVDWLEPGTAVHVEEIREIEAELGFTIEQGDCVLLRSGHFARRAALGAWNPDEAAAGLHVDAMPLLHERRISVLGGDGDSDARPSTVENVGSPIHVLALTAMGVPLLDNLDLEALGDRCAAEHKWTFLAVMAPLNVPHGTGSPINLVAVL